MSAKGTYLNPSHRSCFEGCRACFRCDARGKYAKCVGCSGHHDPFGVVDPHPDDYCDCTAGKLRFVDQHGKVRIVSYNKDPFAGEITMVNRTEDERAWDDYVHDLREKLDDPTWEPVSIGDIPAAHGQMR